jgi:hypothetical protein
MKVYRFAIRGAQWSYHWFSYILGSLRFIENKDEKVNVLIQELQNYQVDNTYRVESLEYFKNDFNFYYDINDLSNNNCEFIEYFGENLIEDDRIDPNAYKYIRSKILSKYINNNTFNNKKVYIRRNNQSKLDFNKIHGTRRNLINEDELCDKLTNIYGFNCINLEDYNFNDKIDIFQNSKIIITPMGGALIFAIFANISTKIIEIYGDPVETHTRNHFKILCEDLKLNYERFSTSVELLNDNSFRLDSSLNMNILTFLEHLEKIGINPTNKDSI